MISDVAAQPGMFILVFLTDVATFTFLIRAIATLQFDMLYVFKACSCGEFIYNSCSSMLVVVR